MNEKDNESKLKRFIKDAFTSEAKASRIPYYFFAICILLTVICVQLNTANRYLKRIAAGGNGTYSFETNSKSNDPHEVFAENSSEENSEQNSENSTSESSESRAEVSSAPKSTSSAVLSTSAEPKPQGVTKTYVINTNSKKIHLSSCSYAANMKEENKLTVQLTDEELQNQYLSNGYAFCSRCLG